ncbi:MAG: hypothetical protein ACRENI_13070 [Gemmatimonadaceae bacterium]
MRMTRSGAAMMAGVLTTLLFVPADVAAQTRDPYPTTLHFGTGLINTPVAWVAPRNADFRMGVSGKEIPFVGNEDALTFASRWNTNIAMETHWLGRFTVGVAAYSQNPEYGFFGRLLLLRDNQFAFLPALAIGARNIGPYGHEERFLIGHDIRLDSTSGEYVEVETGFDTSPTIYGVATKEFVFGASADGLPSSLGLNVGWGTGIFREDGGLGDFYNESGTIAEGLFLGAKFSAHPTPGTTVYVLGENDGWDWNAGVVGDWRGISLGVYLTELEEGSREDASNLVYNYRKWNVSMGYSGNIIDISRGVLLRAHITALTREQTRLELEIEERERRIRGLELALRRAQAGELAEIEQRRQELERQVQEEREAIRRAMERLEEIQRGREPAQPPPTTPPSR